MTLPCFSLRVTARRHATQAVTSRTAGTKPFCCTMHGSATLATSRMTNLNAMLTELHAQTQNITAIFDSCNSGTAARAGSRLATRYFEPATGAVADPGASGDGSSGPASPDLPGLVALTAASDGTPALERNGSGIFTDALLEVLGQATERPLTYAQVARQVPALVAADSYQIPYSRATWSAPYSATAAEQGRWASTSLQRLRTSACRVRCSPVSAAALNSGFTTAR